MPKERFSTELKQFYDTLTNTDLSGDIIKLETCYKDMMETEGTYDGTYVCTNINDKQFETAYGELLDKAYSNPNTKTYSQDILDLQGGISDISNEPGYMKEYKEVKDLHNKLDNKMREIYNPDMEDVHIMHSSTVYMSLAWTVLATSVLYFLFQKL
jgi:hypothetical protein